MLKRVSVIKKFTFIVASLSLLLNGSTLVFSDNKTSFNVNVSEVLSVSISTPTNWATGDINNFLRNKVSINVTTNNSAGFTASMTTKTTETALTNSAKTSATLPTLTENTLRSNFPANYWGYSLDDTDAGNNSSTYRALVGPSGTPITILSSTTASSGSKDFYFGAKANSTLSSGTYTGTVVISVVSGVVDNTTNPITPVSPVTPNPTPNTPSYNPTTNVTSYTYNNTNTTAGTTTTTTNIDTGDTRDAYAGYVPPKGARSIAAAKAQNLTPLAMGLATAATVATASGAFLLYAMRRDGGQNE